MKKNIFKILFLIFTISIPVLHSQKPSPLPKQINPRKNINFCDEFNKIIEWDLHPRTKMVLMERNLQETEKAVEELYQLEEDDRNKEKSEDRNKKINRLYEKLETCLIGYNFSAEFACALVLIEQPIGSDSIARGINRAKNMVLAHWIYKHFSLDSSEIVLILTELNSHHGTNTKNAIKYVIEKFDGANIEEIETTFKEMFGKNYRENPEQPVAEEITKLIDSYKAN